MTSIPPEGPQTNKILPLSSDQIQELREIIKKERPKLTNDFAVFSTPKAIVGRTKIDQSQTEYIFNAKDFLNKTAIDHMRRPCQMQTDIPQISEIISHALEQAPPWISKEELDEVQSQLSSAENSFDTYRTLQFVQARARNPLDKEPKEKTINPNSMYDFEEHFRRLISDNKSKLSQGTDSLYSTQDDGRSILFCDQKSNTISTALTQREFKAVLASVKNQTTIDYFLNLFDLTPLDNADYAKAKEMKEIRKKENEIVAFFKAKPKPEISHKSLPTERRDYEVHQGNGFGVVKSLDTTDSLSTLGLGPCVCFMIHEGHKGLMIHIDHFSGEKSLTQTGAAQFLDRHINEFSPGAKIHLQGANNNSGRKTVIEIYKYLEKNGLLDQVATANVLNGHSGYSSVTLDLGTGEIHPK
jgi:hypothetical protein